MLNETLEMSVKPLELVVSEQHVLFLVQPTVLLPMPQKAMMLLMKLLGMLLLNLLACPPAPRLQLRGGGARSRSRSRIRSAR